MATVYTDFVDPPNDPFDLTRRAGSVDLPIDFDVLSALADPNFGLATTPKASDRAQSAVDGLAGAVTHGLTGIIGTVTDWIADLSHTRESAAASAGVIVNLSEEQQNANTRLDALEDFQGTGVTTPLATSIGGRDIVTFPDSLMLRLYHQDRSG